MEPCCKLTPRIDGWWVMDDHDHCTCSPHMGAHEAHCGTSPAMDLSVLPGWDELVTAVTAIQQAEIDRLQATIQRVRELAEKMQDEQGQSWNSISGNRIRRALEGGEQ